MAVLTRSATLRTMASGETILTKTKTKTKRKLPSSESATEAKKRRTADNAPQVDHGPPAVVPAELSFSFADAKQHLIGADKRFKDLFEKIKCRPFENLEQVHPFRVLVKSILGQQISSLAARSINHKFIRLYDPSLPEKPTDVNATITFFPTPQQVAETEVATLKTAGLSTRKAEYVQDLASRFSDGRLSTEKLIAADDEELMKILTEVRGIGRWTVDMFAIFSLRRPDILPIGDLGVQRGLLRWVLSLHSPLHPFGISPEKIGGNDQNTNTVSEGDNKDTGQGDRSGDASSVLPAANLSTPLRKRAGKGDDTAPMPTPFTPSIEKTLQREGSEPDVLPEGLSVAILKSRLDGKKKIKGGLLTPKEMEDLTECWRPYRSLGVYYMWALCERK